LRKHFFIIVAVLLLSFAAAWAWDFDTGPTATTVFSSFSTGATTIKYCTLYVPGASRTQAGLVKGSAGWETNPSTKINGRVYINFNANAAGAAPDTAFVMPQFSKDNGLTWEMPTQIDTTDAGYKGRSTQLRLTADGGLSLGKLCTMSVDSSWYGDRMRLLVVFAYQGTTGVDSSIVSYRVFGINQYK